MLLVAAELRSFQLPAERWRRIRSLSWTPYFTDGILAGVAGLLNPAGLFYVIASALPSTLGANAGLLSLPSLMRGQNVQSDETVAPIQRSLPWIATGAAGGPALHRRPGTRHHLVALVRSHETQTCVISNSLSTVAQLRAVPMVASLESKYALVSLELPAPLGK